MDLGYPAARSPYLGRMRLSWKGGGGGFGGSDDDDDDDDDDDPPGNKVV